MNKKKILIFFIILLFLIIDIAIVLFVDKPNIHYTEGYEKVSKILLYPVIIVSIAIYKFGHKFGIEQRIKTCGLIFFITFTAFWIFNFFAYLPLYFKDFEADLAVNYGRITSTKEKTGEVVGVKNLFKTIKDEFDLKLDEKQFNNQVYHGDCFTAKSRKNPFFLEINLEQHLDSESETCSKYSGKLNVWLQEAKAKENN